MVRLFVLLFLLFPFLSFADEPFELEEPETDDVINEIEVIPIVEAPILEPVIEEEIQLEPVVIPDGIETVPEVQEEADDLIEPIEEGENEPLDPPIENEDEVINTSDLPVFPEDPESVVEDDDTSQTENLEVEEFDAGNEIIEIEEVKAPIESVLNDEIELPRILINEILADPKERDAENEFIELYNPGLEPVDLSGWSLDDEKLEDNKSYTFDAVIIEPESYLLIMRPESKITLNNDKDSVYLFDKEGLEVDQYHYTKLKSGRSWGRNHGNDHTWTFYTVPSPGLENINFNGPPVAIIDIQKDTKYLKLNVTGASSFDPDGDSLTYSWDYGDGVLNEQENPLIYEYVTPGEKTLTLTVTDEFGLSSTASTQFLAEPKITSSGSGSKSVEVPKIHYPKHQLINEFMPSPYGKDNENEWVELYNSTSRFIDLSGWYLDDEEGASRPYKFPENTHISPGSYLVLKADVLKLSLKNTSDTLRLLAPDKTEIERIDYNDVEDDWSFAKDETGIFVWSKTPTPGLENSFPTPPKAHVFGDLFFEGVLPNPDGTDSGNEQILLKNMTTESINLNYWVLSDLKSEKTLAELQIEPFSTLSLYSDDFKLNLNNSNEALSIFDPYGTLIAEIAWKKSASGAWLFNPDSLLDDMKVEVNRVVDGDTIVVDYEGRLIRLRLIGVDTPETVHPFKPVEFYGKQASEYLKKLLTGQEISLRFEPNKMDKYGRLLAYVYLDDLLVNEEIIRLGYGLAYTRFPFAFLDDFVLVEALAQENALGLWQNKKVKALIDSYFEELEVLGEDAFLLEILEEPVEPELFSDDLTFSEKTLLSKSPLKFINCHSDDLKIDSFMPNSEKGISMEYIRLINTGETSVCLNGWSLDDVLEKGSKPFFIQSGGLDSGAIRTFRKSETRLSLNNSNDCVYLIDPNGEVQDFICYEKTHKNEIFTHEGGDWVPKARVKKTTTIKSKTPRHRFKRDTLSYQFKLPQFVQNVDLLGFDKDDSKIYVTLNHQDSAIAYNADAFDVEMVQLLSDETSFSFNVRDDAKGDPELVSVDPMYPLVELKDQLKISPLPSFLTLAVFALFYLTCLYHFLNLP